MTFRTLIRRSLRHHWRAHLGVVLGAAVGSAALIGALVVGDSVRGSLRENAWRRLCGVHLAMDTGERSVSADLLARMHHQSTNAIAATLGSSTPRVQWGAFGQWNGSALLRLPAQISRQDGQARANAVQCYGMDDRFIHFFLRPSGSAPGTILLNASLARQLNARPGDALILRFPKPSPLSRESAIATRSDSTVALKVTVGEILSSWPGDLSLAPGGVAPLNAFLPIQEMQSAAGQAGRANLLITGWGLQIHPPRLGDQLQFFLRRLKETGHLTGGGMFSAGERAPDQKLLPVVESFLRQNWTLTDAESNLAVIPNRASAELRSPRVFLDPPVVRSALAADANAQPLLTYLATLLRAGTNAAPYSMVAAAGQPWTPADLRDDEIVVSQWLADDLRVKPGDEIALSYFEPESGARLVERTNTFRLRGIVPMEMPWADRALMPDFPGIEKAESTSDWDAGFPLTYKIRQKDEDYWKQFRGTPKAFVTLAAGQKMWGNRFGNLTAIRFPVPTNAIAPEDYRTVLEKEILANLNPEELGLRFEPVREQALQAAEQSQDFGGLFLGFSFFLIAAALLLMAMLFQLGLEQRAPEIGTLLALGFRPKQVRRLLLGEGVALSLLGGVLGALGGLAYARVMLHGLTTVWRDAVGATSLSFHVTGQTLVIGLFASVVVSLVTIWLALRKFVQRPAAELLAGETQTPESRAGSPKLKLLALGALAAALGLVGWTLAKGDTANAGAFFGAGALVLIAGLGFVSTWLARFTNVLRAFCPQNHPASGPPVSPREADLPAGRRQHVTLGSLGLRGCARRRKRSLATVAMLACGSFLIVSIGVFRLDANRDATKRTSGTGGFALIGESTMPVVQDLNSQSGREFFALKEDDLKGVSVVPFRVREGDEASCLNLNRAQKPRLLGVKPELLEGRFAFAKGAGWQSLRNSRREEAHSSGAPNEVAAIGDANSIQWAMGKKVGDTLDYVDERGQPFKVRIVGAVANSILQGQLIIDEAEFVKRFPSESGYRQFLIDAPTNRVAEVSAALSRALQDVGLELTSAPQRLDQFNAIQNTYLGTFQVLGGLGLLLGSVGLGIVVLRNVLERRGELAVLLAVGFRKPTLQRLLLIENGALLGFGLAIGVVAAAVAVLPALLSPGTQLPWLTLALTLAAVLLNGAAWTWAATRVAVRGDLLTALRNE